MSIAVVTGTSSGIGLATVLALGGAGYQVAACMRNLAKSEALESEAAKHGLAVNVVKMDVSDDESVARAFGTIHDMGRVEVLVNNAGVGAATPLELTPIKEHQAIFNTNYFGSIRCTQAVLPEMREAKRGTIINITSVEGLMAFPNQVAYSASKWALECAGEALAHEVCAFGIRVMNVEPGVIMTAIFENAKPFSRYDKSSPYYSIMRRNGKFFSAGHRAGTPPERVADTVMEALNSTHYKLRWRVGEDAEQLVSGRQRMTDEQWVEMGDSLSDEEYNALFKRYFDIEL